MNNGLIKQALKEASDTKCILAGRGVLEQVGEVFSKCFGIQTAVVVADQTTFKVAGEAVSTLLNYKLAAPPIIFADQPHLYADFEKVLELEKRLAESEAVPVVVGSGTLNDLTKLASHRLGRPYMVVATAASMDGYASFGAAITKDGFKQTVSCPGPRGILADFQILETAPIFMNSTGYGDLFGKITAGADWILADMLGIENIDPFAWMLVQDGLPSWTGNPENLNAGNKAAIENLFEGLVMSGLAMQKTKTSRPASGSEHLFSHLWEMEAQAGGNAEKPHGFKVGIGTIASAALYEQLLQRDLSTLNIDELCQKWPTEKQLVEKIQGLFNIPEVLKQAVQESTAKYITPDTLRLRLTLLSKIWPILRENLAVQLKPTHLISKHLKLAGCPVNPAEIGLTRDQLKASYFKARYIRKRFTVLDLAFETGLLEECIDHMFGREGFWGQPF